MKVSQFSHKFDPYTPYWYGLLFGFIYFEMLVPYYLLALYEVFFSRFFHHQSGGFVLFNLVLLLLIGVLFGKYQPFLFNRFEKKDFTMTIFKLSIGVQLGSYFYIYLKGAEFHFINGLHTTLFFFIGGLLGSKLINEKILAYANKIHSQPQFPFTTDPELNRDFIKKALLVVIIFVVPFIVLLLLGAYANGQV